MTAAEAYVMTMGARREYVLDSIRTAARNCRFDAEVWYTYIYDDLRKELEELGFRVNRDGNRYLISWAEAAPPPAAPNSPAARSIDF